MRFRFWKRQQREADLDEEVQAHLQMAIRDRMDRGETREEAEEAAQREFGNVGLIKEVTRDTWGFVWLERLQQDLRYSFLNLCRNLVFTSVAVLSLALAIGANTAIFSLLNALVLRDLPVRDPGSLVQLATSTRMQAESYLTLSMFRDLSQRQQVFSAVIGAWGSSVMTVNDNALTFRGLLWAATGNLYEELGMRPALGRLLVDDDMTLSPPAAEPVAVLGYGFWQRNYGGDTTVVGRTIRVEGAPFTVVGVAPAGFTGFGLVTEPDITIPLTAIPRVSGRRGAAILTEAPAVRMVGRLRDTATIDEARAHLAALWPSVREAALPPSFTQERRADFLSTALNVTSAAKGTETSLRAQYTRPLMILLGIASLVLLIACTNIASLMLSGVSARRHEIGVRLALGASRWRVAQQLFTEGVLLSIGGAVGGIALSFWACARIAAIVFDEFLVPVVFDGAPQPGWSLTQHASVSDHPALRFLTKLLMRSGTPPHEEGNAGH